MKYDSELDARREGERVKSKLAHPEVWELEVFENLGWHWTLYCRPISLRKHAEDRYGCMVESPGMKYKGTGWPVVCDKIKAASTPQKAVENAVQALRDMIDDCLELQNRAEEAAL